MTLLARVNARFKGLRVYALAVLLALPDILNGLAGFDFSDVIPFGWATKVGTGVGLLRLVLIPIIVQVRRGARLDDEGPA
jgi:hypothetical protein